MKSPKAGRGNAQRSSTMTTKMTSQTRVMKRNLGKKNLILNQVTFKSGLYFLTGKSKTKPGLEVLKIGDV
jgi:hypothetical protein